MARKKHSFKKPTSKPTSKPTAKNTADTNVNTNSNVNTNEYKSQGVNDLFEGNLAKAALAALSPEEKERYRIIGEQLYGTINFENGEVINKNPEEMVEAVSYLHSQLQSGIHPSMLESNEKELLSNILGKDWYIRYGYVEEDLENIVTLVLDKNMDILKKT